jgi:hypothetical protein
MERNKMSRRAVYIITAAALLVISCSGADKKAAPDGPVSGAGDNKAAELESRIAEINENKPSTISSNVTIDGDNRGKKFRFEGRMLYDGSGYAQLKLADYIFKGPVFDFYRNREKLYFYYPAERKLFIDSAEKIRFSSYAGFPVDFNFVYNLLAGSVPVIEGGSAVKTLGEERGDSFHLILENSDYFQNIYFRKNIPERILLVHKKSRDKIEVYIKAHRKKGKSIFFNKLRIVVPGSDFSLNLNFTRTELNEPLKIDPFTPEKLKGSEIIRIN